MNPTWIALCVAMTLTGAPSDPLGESVQTLTTCDNLHRRECLVATATLGQLGDEVIAPLLRRVSKMPRAGQLLALSVLDDRSGREATEALMTLAGDRRVDAAVRALAIDELGTRAHNRLTDKLLRVVRDRSTVVRVAAARVLSNRLYSADPRILKALLRAARDNEAAVRVEALFGCGFSADPSAGPTLRRALADPVADVRRAAAEGLGLVLHKAAIDPLISALSDADPLVVRAAARALTHQTGQRFGDDRSRWTAWRTQERRR